MCYGSTQKHSLQDLPSKLGLSGQAERCNFGKLDASNSIIHRCSLLNTQAIVWLIFGKRMFLWGPNAKQHDLICRSCFPCPPPP